MANGEAMKKILGYILIIIVMSIFASESFSKTTSFMPDNELWREDCLYCKSANGIDEDTFKKIIDKAKEIYTPIAENNKEELEINSLWEDATVNANCSRYGGVVTINMYGGLARRQEVTAEGFTLVLCHELSHAYGGTPYIRPSSKMSAEGQADYMATFDCAKKVFKSINAPGLGMEPTKFIIDTCKGNKTCLSSLVGGQSLGNLLSTLSSEAAPDYETPDTTVVPKTLLSYPETTQCRLDTYFAGTLGLKRPACWFKN